LEVEQPQRCDDYLTLKFKGYRVLIGLRGTENASAPHSMNESNYKPYIIVRARIWTKGLAVIKESNTNNLWKNGSMYDHNFPPKSPVSTSHHQIYEWPPAMLYSSLLERDPHQKEKARPH